MLAWNEPLRWVKLYILVGVSVLLNHSTHSVTCWEVVSPWGKALHVSMCKCVVSSMRG